MKHLTIVEVCTSDLGGGAERVCLELTKGFRKRGHDSWLVAGKKNLQDEWIVEVTNIRRGGTKEKVGSLLDNTMGFLPMRARGILRRLTRPSCFLEFLRGREDFNFPWTRHLHMVTPCPPDIIHLHNLHGGYFDLRVLSNLSQRHPAVVTVHDQWLMTGHCAHSMGCIRWKIGCGNCPNLSTYPALKKDATSYNWRRKKQIYERSRLYVVSPSRWLLETVRESILARAVVEAKVIANGVNREIFSPGSKAQQRGLLGWSENGSVVLLCSNRIRKNPFKDYDTVEKALNVLAGSWRERALKVVALGENGPTSKFGSLELLFESFRSDPSDVASFFRAADVFVHASKADTFPNVVLESLACGTPVVATAVGGIPEQIKGLDWEAHPGEYPRYSSQEATGILVPPRDPEALARALALLLNDEDLRERLGRNAAVDARVRFDLEKQVDAYLNWFEEILCRDGSPSRCPRRAT